MHDDDDTDELPDLTNRELLRVVMQEIADTHLELRGDIADLRTELKGDIADLRTELKGDIAQVKSELHTLRLEVHQNQSTFISNQMALEKRVKAVEMAA